MKLGLEQMSVLAPTHYNACYDQLSMWTSVITHYFLFSDHEQSYISTEMLL